MSTMKSGIYIILEIGPKHLRNAVIRPEIVGSLHLVSGIDDFQRPFGLTEIIGIPQDILAIEQDVIGGRHAVPGFAP
jgi:hypothetical protein